MEKKALPKVLVVTTNAWRDNTGINTLIEFFKCWNPDRIAQIYTKSTLPKTTVCNKFFSISENAVMRSVMNRSITTGKKVHNETVNSSLDNPSAKEEQKYTPIRVMLGNSYLSAENLFGNLENGKTQSWTILLMNLTRMCCLFRFIQQYIWEEFRSILLAVLKNLWCPI